MSWRAVSSYWLLALSATGLAACPTWAADPPAEPASPTIQQTAATSAATYKLEYKFQKGDTIPYQVSHDVTLTTQKGSASLTAIQQSNSWKRYVVVEVDKDGAATLEPTIDRVKMSIRSGDKVVAYDSASGETPPAAVRGIGESIGRALARVKVTPSGSLISARSLLAKPGNQQRDGQDDAAAEGELNVLVEFPKKPLEIGEVWKDQLKVNVAVDRGLQKPITLQRQYTLQSVDGHLATISLKTSVLTLIKDPKLQVQLIQRTPSGTIVFDMEQGRIVSRKLNIDELVIGFAGGDSKIRAQSHRVEQLMPAQAAEGVTRKPIEASTQR